LLFSERAKGALTPEQDAALKSEFRTLMQSIPAHERRSWFDSLAQEGDYGRLGVLVAMEPTLRPDALALSLPGRDEALKIAADVRGLIREGNAVIRDAERLVIESKPNPSQADNVRLVALAIADSQTSDTTRPVITDEERARFAELSESVSLTKAEGHELVSLGNRMSGPQAHLKQAVPVVTDRDREIYHLLMAKPQLNGAEQATVIRIGNAMQAEQNTVPQP
jgi:hypothetical protein